MGIFLYMHSLPGRAERTRKLMNREKILLADDSELNRAILMDVLGQDYPIIEAANGREAIEALQAHSGEIGVVLLDVVMPEADGFAVLEYMNIKGLVEDIPVIMISAETSGAYIDRAFKLGAADYVCPASSAAGCSTPSSCTPKNSSCWTMSPAASTRKRKTTR